MRWDVMRREEKKVTCLKTMLKGKTSKKKSLVMGRISCSSSSSFWIYRYAELSKFNLKSKYHCFITSATCPVRFNTQLCNIHKFWLLFELCLFNTTSTTDGTCIRWINMLSCVSPHGDMRIISHQLLGQNLNMDVSVVELFSHLSQLTHGIVQVTFTFAPDQTHRDESRTQNIIWTLDYRDFIESLWEIQIN